MKRIRLLLVLLTNVILTNCSDAQVVVQTWVDPCTNTVQTATFPINGPGVLIMYRGQSKLFTAASSKW